MLLVYLIAALWIASLLLVAGLCAAARVGDETLGRELLAEAPSAAAKLRPAAAAPVREPTEAGFCVAA